MEFDWSVDPLFVGAMVVMGAAIAVWLIGIEIGDLYDQWRARHPRKR